MNNKFVVTEEIAAVLDAAIADAASSISRFCCHYAAGAPGGITWCDGREPFEQRIRAAFADRITVRPRDDGDTMPLDEIQRLTSAAEKQAALKVRARDGCKVSQAALDVLDVEWRSCEEQLRQLLAEVFDSPGPISEEAGNLINPFAYHPSHRWKAMKERWERLRT